MWDDARVPTGIRFSIFLSFPILEMSDEEVIAATMRRIRALVESGGGSEHGCRARRGGVL
ncbi:MAG: hypothetical protein QXU11_10440 [Thermoproteota archaeon]